MRLNRSFSELYLIPVILLAAPWLMKAFQVGLERAQGFRTHQFLRRCGPLNVSQKR